MNGKGFSAGPSIERDPGAQQQEIRRLYTQRPRSPFLRWSTLAVVLLVVVAWSNREIWPGEWMSPRRAVNLDRFLGELRPFPLQGQDLELSLAEVSIVAEWATDILRDKGYTATVTTLAISVAAIVLAALGALALTLPAARTVATPEPYSPPLGSASTTRRWFWRIVLVSSRGLLILSRSIPEYIWAFIFLAILGPGAWPLILALALHNLGILGKLNAEVVDDLEDPPLTALRSLGATRLQIAAAGIFPLSLPRFLLFFFYRWETCVREATVLGMLGTVSLGYWIVDARARNHYDEMFFFVLLGAALVLIGDLFSALVRRAVRQAA